MDLSMFGAYQPSNRETNNRKKFRREMDKENNIFMKNC